MDFADRLYLVTGVCSCGGSRDLFPFYLSLPRGLHVGLNPGVSGRNGTCYKIYITRNSPNDGSCPPLTSLQAARGPDQSCPDSPVIVMEPPDILSTPADESRREGGVSTHDVNLSTAAGPQLTEHSPTAHEGTFTRFSFSLMPPPPECSPAPQMISPTVIQRQEVGQHC